MNIVKGSLLFLSFQKESIRKTPVFEKVAVISGCFNQLKDLTTQHSFVRSTDLINLSKDFSYSSISFSEVYEKPLKSIKEHMSLLKQETNHSFDEMHSAFYQFKKEVTTTSYFMILHQIFSPLFGNFFIKGRVEKVENALEALSKEIAKEAKNLASYL